MTSFSLRARLAAARDHLSLPFVATVLAATGLVVERVWPRLLYPAMGPDPAVYFVGGMKLARGQLVYARLWDIKPPAIHELIATLALLSGRNPRLTYLLTLLVSIAVTVGLVALVYRLVADFTEDPLAAVTAGLAVLSYSGTATILNGGPRVKHFAAFGALAAVLLYCRDRLLGAGVAGALAAAFWQPAVVVPLLLFVGVVFEAQDDGTRTRLLTLAGGVLGTAVLITLPWVVTGNLTPLLGQTVAAPLIAPSGSSSVIALTAVAGRLGLLATVVVLLGIGGLATAAYMTRQSPRFGEWLLPALGGAALLTASFQYGRPDLVWLVALVAPGVGYVVSYIPPTISNEGTRRLTRYSMVGFVLAAAIVGGPIAPTDRYVGTAGDEFLNGESAAVDCHYRLSGPERRYVEIVGVDVNRTSCYGTQPGESLATLFG